MTKPTTNARRRWVMGKMATVFLTWRRHLQRLLLPEKITLKQAYVLRELTRNDYLCPSQIAAQLYCDRPTATVIIRNMQKAGWVAKEKDETNRKFVRISITEAGRQKRAALDACSRTQTDFDPLAYLTDEEAQEFERLLDKINAHIMVLR